LGSDPSRASWSAARPILESREFADGARIQWSTKSELESKDRSDQRRYEVQIDDEESKGATTMNIITTSDTPPADVVTRTAHKESLDDLAYAVGESTLGSVLLARSAGGICSILIGSGAEELKNDLATRFPESRLIRNDRKLSDDLQKVLRFVEAPAEGLDLPIDMRGTPFQRRVWEELLRVPTGAIITYGALATRVGEPKTARAVASACAANAIALAIPCHRVVKNNGTLSGYRWGLERKRALLERETRA
jgi:O-6-methylguanine DNA methyltransferase